MKMTTLRTTIAAALLVGLSPLAANAQSPPVVIAGQSRMAFDHDAASAADSTGYELCVDNSTTCSPLTVAPLSLIPGSYGFTLPANVPRGDRVLRVRALWSGGVSDPSDTLTFRVSVKPGKPTSVRIAP